MAIAHFAIGASITTSVAAVLISNTRFPRTYLLLGGAWAMVPDVHWVAPIHRGALKTAHNSVAANIFFFHHLLDAYDPSNSRMFAVIAVGILGLTVVIVDAWEVTSFDRLR